TGCLEIQGASLVVVMIITANKTRILIVYNDNHASGYARVAVIFLATDVYFTTSCYGNVP
ncbi:hypothetical protein, partial [Cronobacter sakazakii]|uniref:hypothetical protein n=1 Tax=Cronobacter sakazakii TaxID=28141 RepID=UPI003A8C35C5